MDQATAIKLADGYIETAGFSISGLRANVVDPVDREYEVAVGTRTDNCGESVLKHSVFIGPYGHVLGMISTDPSTQKSESPELPRIPNEDPCETAIRFLVAYGIDTANLDSRIIEEPQFLKVWYELDTEDDVMGGWYTVYMTNSGDLICVQQDQ